MTDPTRFQFTRNFYKKFLKKQQYLEAFAPEPYYLQAFATLASDQVDNDSSHVRILESNLHKYIQHKRRQLQQCSPAQLLRAFQSNLDQSEQLIVQDKDDFLQSVDSLINKSYQLRQITTIQRKLDTILERYSELLENIENSRLSVDRENVKAHLERHYNRVLKLIDLNFSTTAGDMSFAKDDASSTTSHGYQQRVKDEVEKKLRVVKIPSEEVQILKKQLFHSGDSLATKERVSKQSIQMKVNEAKTQMRSISELELSIADMDRQIELISESSTKAKVLLEKKKLDMSSVILDLVRLNSLLDNLNMEISTRLADFTKELGKLDEERERILNDPNLTQAERQQRLKEIDDQITHLKKTHSSEMKLLETHKSNINLEIESTLQSEIAELERMKLGKTSSECLRIDEKIRMLEEKLSTHLTTSRLYLEDEHGRYYLNADGEKIYKASSFASEYQVIDGQLVKVRSASRLLYDDAGDYYLNDKGEKVYVQKYEVDEFGRFYVDADGNKVYKANPYAAEFKLVNGELVKVKSAIHLLFDDTGDYYLDADGNKVYVQKYEVDEFGRYYLDADGNKVYKADPYAAEYRMIDGVMQLVKDAETSVNYESSLDLTLPPPSHFDYVREYLGKQLRLALAATIMHQPNDPINFIANHLLKQRHAELANVVRQIEEQTIAEERERVRQLEEEQKNATVIDPCNPCAQYNWMHVNIYIYFMWFS